MITESDEQIARLRPVLGERLHCRPGCADCCRPFSVFALEAAMIAGQEIRPAASPAAADVCVFLENGLCRIYRFRPLLCRGQGLPLAYIDDSAEAEHPCLEISACLMNFPEDTEFAMEELLFLDETNRRLAALNIQYCRQARLEAGRRVPLAAIFSP